MAPLTPPPLIPPTTAAVGLPSVGRAESRAAWLTLGAGIVLLAIKFVAYLLTHSSAVYSDALESIVNVFASGLLVYSISLAHAPADRKHPYGHGKVEFLTAAFEGGMILAAALLIGVRALEQLLQGVKLERLNLGLTLVIIAGALNGGIGWVLRHRGRRVGSIALEAAGQHLLADAITSAAVLIALALVRVSGWAWIDPATALLVALYIMALGVVLMRRSFAGLMDEQDVGDDKMIRALLDAHVTRQTPDGVNLGAEKQPEVCSYHKLRHRHSGRYHWVDFHLVVPADWSIAEAHRVASKIEYEIEQALGEGNATAHIEPCDGVECAACPRNRPHEAVR